MLVIFVTILDFRVNMFSSPGIFVLFVLKKGNNSTSNFDKSFAALQGLPFENERQSKN